ncbi:hypothetical protein F3Y22_tig00110893pilonHSYRG00668 [Hibiscus syriacus]|uniref:Uncharacterized protein n=1 Tax=Hibiscus syriacus TaxID=106335 RepID=A0A6A2ZH43_HIBSY|nr:hypothetical protein F3Y22_tig00110893pilonHSYRG00668 [Hibiscus syriacus]
MLQFQIFLEFVEFKSLIRVVAFLGGCVTSDSSIDWRFLMATTTNKIADLILEAIDALDEKAGSNKTTIAKHRVDSFRSPGGSHHSAFPPPQQDETKRSIVMLKNNYMRPARMLHPSVDVASPKPKAPLPAGTVVSPLDLVVVLPMIHLLRLNQNPLPGPEGHAAAPLRRLKRHRPPTLQFPKLNEAVVDRRKCNFFEIVLGGA